MTSTTTQLLPNRDTNNWIDSYLEYTKDSESPEELHFWTGMCMLSAALKRQVYMDRGTYKLYPNLYVLLVGESAKIRKSVAMEIGINLFLKAVPDVTLNIGFMKGRMTPEGLVKYMNRTKLVEGERKSDGSKSGIIKPESESHTLIYADELATLFGYDRLTACRMSILLTETYGCPSEYPHTTKSDAPILVRNLYNTLLAGTDPRNLKVLPEEAVGGLLGRTIFVTANKRRKKVAWPKRGDPNLYSHLVVDLFRISNLKGVFEPTKTALELFEKWYDEFSDMDITDTRLSAFHERAHDTALKIAMLISVSVRDDLIVTEEHVKFGIQTIEKQMVDFQKSMDWAGTNIYAQNRAKFIDTLKRHNGLCTRRTMMRAMDLNKDEIDMLIASMESEGRIEIVIQGREVILKVTPEEVLRWKGGKI